MVYQVWNGFLPQGSILDPILFLLYLYFENWLKHSKCIHFTDDVLAFLPGKTHLENELVINLKPGKTESMLFATCRKLSQNKKNLKLEYKSQPIVSTVEYNILDPSWIKHYDLVVTLIKCTKKDLESYDYCNP